MVNSHFGCLWLKLVPIVVSMLWLGLEMTENEMLEFEIAKNDVFVTEIRSLMQGWA